MLDAAGLKSSLLAILNGSIASPSSAEAGVNWADAIGNYAITGTANAVPAVEAPGSRAALAAALETAFSTLPGSPTVVAAGIATAMDTYWVTMLFTGQVGPPVPVGGPALVTSLQSIFMAIDPTLTWDNKATSICDAIHTYTNTGNITVPFPGPVSFPVV